MKKYLKLLPILALVFAVGLIGHSLITVDAQEEGVIPDTVYFNDIDVSGMTKEEAQRVLSSHVDSLQNKSFTLTTGDKSIQVLAEDLGLEIANPEIVEEALNLGKTGNLIARYKDKKDLEKEPKKFTISYSSDEDKIETLLGVNMSNLNQEAVNCGLKRENGSFQITEGADGIKVNVEKSVKAIQDYLKEDWNLSNAEIALETDVTKPKGTKEELSKVKDLLGSFHTDYSSSASGRAKNVNNGAEKIDGTVVYPGDQFSVYKAVSPFDAENGYELAGSYENGTTVQTYGGGICQVSSTIYVSMLLAGIAPSQRYAHSLPVDYVPKGLDSAIVEGYKDLTFTNKFDFPIVINATTQEGVLTVSFLQQTEEPLSRPVNG